MAPKGQNRTIFYFLIFTIIYVSSAFSSETSPCENGVGFIKVSIGNIRLKPGTHSSIIAKLQKGDKLTIIGKEGDWYMVKLPDNRLGWAHQMLIRKEESAIKIEKKATAEKVERTVLLKVPIGRVREQPTLSAAIKFRLKKSDIVTVIDEKEDWYLIKIEDGRTGWAHQSLFIESGHIQIPPKKIYKKIHAIYTHVLSEEEEKVIFVLNDSFTPKTFVVTGDRPKVVCDFFDVHLGSGVERKIEVNGGIIQQINIEPSNTVESKVRIVLNLAPGNSYNVQPVFYKKNNYYALVIKRSL